MPMLTTLQFHCSLARRFSLEETRVSTNFDYGEPDDQSSAAPLVTSRPLVPFRQLRRTRSRPR